MTRYAVWLTKDGLRRECDGGEEPFLPDDVFELLGLWHCPVAEIDPEYTLGDLCAMLREVHEIGRLCGLLGCDLPAFLEEARGEPTVDSDMRCLEVYNRFLVSGYEEDRERPDEPPRWLDLDEAEAHDAVQELIGQAVHVRLFDVTEIDPVTGKPSYRRVLPGTHHGTFQGPHLLARAVRGWGRWGEPGPGFYAANPDVDPVEFEGGFAVALAPMNEVAHLPLRYNPRVVFRERRARGTGVLFEERVAITFGELVHAVFDGLGMLGTPELRDLHRALLRERVTDLREAMEDDD